MTVCMHLRTHVLPDARGLVCSDCGDLVFDLEKRECGKCANFLNSYSNPHCTKRNESVFRTMHALYNVNNGTCFEDKRSD